MAIESRKRTKFTNRQRVLFGAKSTCSRASLRVVALALFIRAFTLVCPAKNIVLEDITERRVWIFKLATLAVKNFSRSTSELFTRKKWSKWKNLFKRSNFVDFLQLSICSKRYAEWFLYFKCFYGAARKNVVHKNIAISSHRHETTT